MEHEGLVAFSLVDGFDFLLVFGSAEGRNGKGLGFAPRKQRGAVGPRKDRRLAGDRPDVVGRPSVDPLPRRKKGASHRLFGDLFKDLSDKVFFGVRVVRQMSVVDLAQLLPPLQLIRDGKSLREVRDQGVSDALLQPGRRLGDAHGPFLLPRLLRRVSPASR